MDFSSSAFRYETKQVLGINTKHPLHMIKSNQCIVLVSGSHIVFYNPKSNRQTQFVFHSSNKISSIAVSRNEKRLAVAQSVKGSVISVYDLSEGKSISSPQYTLKGHSLGVEFLEWSPNSRYLVSASNEDGGLFVWENKSRISQNKLGQRINKMMFSSSEDLITVGVKHFKVWGFDKGNIIRTQKNGVWMMNAKSVALGKQLEDKEFVNVAQKSQNLIALTSSGILCVIKGEACQKAVDLLMSNPKGLSVFYKWALCGGENSTIKIVDLDSLQLVTTFPKPPPINQENTQSQNLSQQNEAVYSNCIGIQVVDQTVIALYDSGMVYVFQFRDSSILSLHYLNGHSKELTCLSILQQIPNQISFLATSSTDKTIRVWHLYSNYVNDDKAVDLAEVMDVKRNSYCKYLTRVIYCQEVINKIKATKSLLLAASNQSIYVYSLSSYQLIYQLPMDNKLIDALEVHDNQLYVGLSDKTIVVYSISETMLKDIKTFEVPMRIQTIHIIQKMMILKGKGTAIFVDLKESKRVKDEKDVLALSCFGKEVYYIQGRKLHVYSLVKIKQKEHIPLQKQLSGLKVELRVIDNLIVTLEVLENDMSRVRVWNREGSLIHERVIHEVVEGVEVFEDGECILANQSGSMLVQQFSYRQKLTGVQKQFKQYFNQNNLGWSTGSLWISQNLKQSNSNNIDDLLISISSPGIKEVPHKDTVQIPYKNNDHKMSLFIPSKINEQMNNVLENISKFQKKQNLKSPRADAILRDSLVLKIEDDPFESVLEAEAKLVESVTSTVKPQANNFVMKEEQEDIPVMKYIRPKSKKSEAIVDDFYQILTSQNGKSDLISNHPDKLKSIYLQLHQHFGQGNQKTIEEIQKLSYSYVANLKSLLQKL